MSVRLALVGCGSIARHHLAGIKNSPAGLLAVAVLVDPDAGSREKFADEVAAALGERPLLFPSLTAALAEAGDKFDAVNIMTPNDTHEPLAVQSFGAQKHVVLEKPMATTLEACERILAAARAAGTVFAVAENAEFWGEVMALDEAIKSGAYGEVVTARAKCWESAAGEWSDDYAPGKWRSDVARAGGGYVFDSASHWIRPLRMWLGEIDEVVAVTGRSVQTMAGESFAHAIFRFRSGQVASFEGLLAEGTVSPQPWFQVQCRKGELTIDANFQGGAGARAFTPEHPTGKLLRDPEGWGPGYQRELEDFARRVLANATPLHPGATAEARDARVAAATASAENSLGETRTLLAMFRSAQNRCWEKV